MWKLSSPCCGTFVAITLMYSSHSTASSGRRKHSVCATDLRGWLRSGFNLGMTSASLRRHSFHALVHRSGGRQAVASRLELMAARSQSRCDAQLVRTPIRLVISTTYHKRSFWIYECHAFCKYSFRQHNPNDNSKTKAPSSF